MRNSRADAALALQSAVAAHQSGDLTQARRLYKTVLAAGPENFDALHLLGMVESGLGRHQEAARLIGRALRLRSGWAPAHTNLGNVLMKLDRAGEALASYDRALALDPADVLAWTNRGNALVALGRMEAALASHDQALALAPDYAEAHYNRAAVLATLDRPQEALAAYDQAIARAPDYADAHFNRGNILLRLERFAEALASFERVVASDPSRQEGWFNRGEALVHLKQPEEALASFEQALALRPGDAETHARCGHILLGLERYLDALACFDRAVALRPDSPFAHRGRGMTLLYLRHLDEALASFERALARNPKELELRATLLLGRGNAYGQMGEDHAALADSKAALAIKPDLAGAHFLAANSHLRCGDLEAGWKAYEWRQQALAEEDQPVRRFAAPAWRGETDLAGCTILIHAEQGLGDTIQFCRYVPLLAARGARVILEVQPQLRRLLGGLAGVTQLVAQGEEAPAHEVQCPLLSLPYVFGTRMESIPCDIPYLTPDRALAAAWATRLGPRKAPRVGLVWSGNLQNVAVLHRPIPLPRLLPGLIGGIEYHCLQNEIFGADESILDTMAETARHSATPEIARHSEALTDFAETAALMAQMDLVVSIDTSVAHLAGALGKEVWILLPYAADWRWFTGRNDSPWYPTARLFRQSRRGEWETVVDELRAALIARFGQPG